MATSMTSRVTVTSEELLFDYEADIMEATRLM